MDHYSRSLDDLGTSDEHNLNLGARQGDEGLVDEVLGWIGWQNYLCFGFDVDYFGRRCFDYCFDCRSYYHRGHHDYFGLLGPCPEEDHRRGPWLRLPLEELQWKKRRTAQLRLQQRLEEHGT